MKNLFLLFFLLSSFSLRAMEAAKSVPEVSVHDFGQLVRLGALAEIEKLVDQGVDVNQILEGNQTAVQIALHQRNSELFDYIVSIPSFDPDACNSDGESAIETAILVGLDYVEVLIEYGAKLKLSCYPLAKEKGAAGVFDYMRLLRFPYENDETDREYPHLALPEGEYTFEEIFKAVESRHTIAQKEACLKNCALCQKPNCVTRCSLCKQSYYCSEEHQKEHRHKHMAERHQPQECVICYEIESEGRQEKCGHIFHENCLRQWIDKKKKDNPKELAFCPSCKTALD